MSSQIKPDQMNPIENILNWYENIIPAQKEDIAFTVLAMVPGYDRKKGLDLLNCDLIQEFSNFLKHTSQLPKLNIIGYTLAIKECINYSLKSKATKENWVGINNHFDFIKIDAVAKGNIDIAEIAKKRKMEIPLRSRQWINTADSWEKVLEHFLNEEALEQWLYLT